MVVRPCIYVIYCKYLRIHKLIFTYSQGNLRIHKVGINNFVNIKGKSKGMLKIFIIFAV